MKSQYEDVQGVVRMAFGIALAMQVCAAVTAAGVELGYGNGESEDCGHDLRALALANAGGLVLVLGLYLWNRYAAFIFWLVLSSVFLVLSICWTFADSNCSDEYTLGFAVIAIESILTFFLLVVTFICSCIFGIGLCIGYGLMSKYETLS